MKIFTFFSIFILTGLILPAQSILRYHFENSLSEGGGVGPTLTVLGNQGIYLLDTLNEINNKTKIVYRFEQNSGFQFPNASSFIGTTYTIELYFVFDELTSWKRVIDWKNRKSDNGAYVYYGEINFYPYLYSEEAPVLPGEYTYYVVTRDGLSKKLLIYTDAKVEIDFIDDYDDALPDADNVLNFFHDDLIVPNEASSGAVALLNIYNYVLDSTTIKQKYNELNQQVFAVDEKNNKQGGLSVFPNPVNDHMTIRLDNLVLQDQAMLSLVNSAGNIVYKKNLNQGSIHTLDIGSLSLPDGIYLVRIESERGSYFQKVMIRH